MLQQYIEQIQRLHNNAKDNNIKPNKAAYDKLTQFINAFHQNINFRIGLIDNGDYTVKLVDENSKTWLIKFGEKRCHLITQDAQGSINTQITDLSDVISLVEQQWRYIRDEHAIG